jgi:holo-[acyl-carrier protein] synthase
MIVGLGIDIIDLDRIQHKVGKENGFKEKVFSPAEIAFCERNVNSVESYAARFAAKEAFLKATGRGLTLGFNLMDIEVLNDEMGKPFIQLRGDFQEFANQNNFTKFHVSLSHTKTAACAVVIIES